MMSSSWFKVLASSIISMPALLFLTLVVLPTRGEYYFPSYAIMGGAFFGISLLTGIIVAIKTTKKMSRMKPVFFLFVGAVIAWLFSLMVLALLSITPLCVGQNNGDGNNDIVQCIVQDGLVAVVYTPIAIFLISLASLITGWLISWKDKTEKILKP
jgi:hypothetical protein